MKWLNAAIIVTAMLAEMGCSSTHNLAVTEPVGPGRSEAARSGALQVYTATEEHADGDNTYYRPHKEYLVYTKKGQKVKFVLNHVGTMDETPSIVYLASGSYDVLAEAEGYGRVRIPVVIKANRTTVVHLERGWKAPENAQASDLVRMPDGQPIGWRSETVNQKLVSVDSHRN
jgi:hypothetical protein